MVLFFQLHDTPIYWECEGQLISKWDLASVSMLI